jgi:hypothetical protein
MRPVTKNKPAVLAAALDRYGFSIADFTHAQAKWLRLGVWLEYNRPIYRRLFSLSGPAAPYTHATPDPTLLITTIARTHADLLADTTLDTLTYPTH